MLWLGLVTRDTGISASHRLEIKDKADALSFDLAVSLRLLRFDNEKDAANKKWWAHLLGSESGDSAGDEVRDYGDSQANVW